VQPAEPAVTIAVRFGLTVTDPVTLADSNNVVVWLAPSSVVAKVATGHHGGLRHELDVATHLAAGGAPVVPPSGRLPPGVHHEAGFDVTFWEYHAQEGQPAVVTEALAGALAELHEVLASYPAPLPAWSDELSAVGDVLVERRVPALSAPDRELLLATLDELLHKVAGRTPTARALHGSPHGGNVLVVAGAPRFIDFETACAGPPEWDPAHVGADVVAAYPATVDSELLELCRGLVSVKTATWCWARFEHPELRWHAHHHLALVRRLTTL
jgi:hypothetical protein